MASNGVLLFISKERNAKRPRLSTGGSEIIDIFRSVVENGWSDAFNSSELTRMTSDSNTGMEGLDRRLRGGDTEALAELFARERERLWRMIHFRLAEPLRGRLEPDDVLQEAEAEKEEASPEIRAERGHSSEKKVFKGTISFNKASSQQLQKIPGIGPVMAERLVTFRKAKGGKVQQYQDFLEVKGIGKKKLESFKKYFTLE